MNGCKSVAAPYDKIMATKFENLERLLLDGLNSGDPIEVYDNYWDNFKKRLKHRVEVKLKSTK